MAAAVNAVVQAGGGIAVSRDGKVINVIPLPIAGYISPEPLQQVADIQRRLELDLAAIGEFLPLYRPRIFQVMLAPLACLPGPRLTDMGLFDGTTGEPFDLIVQTADLRH